jgi:hypothetical protein
MGRDAEQPLETRVGTQRRVASLNACTHEDRSSRRPCRRSLSLEEQQSSQHADAPCRPQRLCCYISTISINCLRRGRCRPNLILLGAVPAFADPGGVPNGGVATVIEMAMKEYGAPAPVIGFGIPSAFAVGAVLVGGQAIGATLSVARYEQVGQRAVHTQKLELGQFFAESGFVHLSPENREKSRSVVHTMAPCSSAIAARTGSITSGRAA